MPASARRRLLQSEGDRVLPWNLDWTQSGPPSPHRRAALRFRVLTDVIIAGLGGVGGAWPGGGGPRSPAARTCARLRARLARRPRGTTRRRRAPRSRTPQRSTAASWDRPFVGVTVPGPGCQEFTKERHDVQARLAAR